MARQRPLAKLRPLRATGLDRLAAWLPDVAYAAGCDRWTNDGELRAAIDNPTILTTGSGYNCFVAYQLGTPHAGAALIRLLAVAPDSRRTGLGGRVALALEKRLASSTKTTQIYVAVPPRNGIALYFWLRLGYRPLTKINAPQAPTSSSAWMVRDLD